MTPCLLPTPCSRRTPSRPHLLTSTPSIPSHPLIPALSPHLPIAPAISLPSPAPIPLFPLLPQTGEMAPSLFRLPRNSLQDPHPCAHPRRQLRLCNPHSHLRNLCSPCRAVCSSWRRTVRAAACFSSWWTPRLPPRCAACCARCSCSWASCWRTPWALSSSSDCSSEATTHCGIPSWARGAALTRSWRACRTAWWRRASTRRARTASS